MCFENLKSRPYSRWIHVPASLAKECTFIQRCHGSECGKMWAGGLQVSGSYCSETYGYRIIQAFYVPKLDGYRPEMLAKKNDFSGGWDAVRIDGADKELVRELRFRWKKRCKLLERKNRVKATAS